MYDKNVNNLINTISAIAAITENELNHLRSIIKTYHIAEGDYFVEMGEIPRYIGFVASGVLRIFYIDPNGTEFTTHFFVENRFVTSYADFLEQQSSRFSIQALEDSLLFVIDRDTFTKLLARDINWQIVIRKIIEDMFSRKLRRENELLSYDAEQRYELF